MNNNIKCFHLSNSWDVVRFVISGNEVTITGADKRGSAPERISVVSLEVAQWAWKGLIAEGYKRDMSY